MVSGQRKVERNLSDSFPTSFSSGHVIDSSETFVPIVFTTSQGLIESKKSSLYKGDRRINDFFFIFTFYIPYYF